MSFFLPFRRILRIPMTVLSLFLCLVVLSPAGLSAQVSWPESQTVTPEPPLLLLPTDGAITTGISDPPLGIPTLSWQAVTDATKYQIQISVSSGFATTVVSTETDNGSYTPLIALGDGIFYWRVRARVANSWGSYADAFSFEVDWGDGGALQPTLLSPEQDGVRAAFDPDDFSWTAMPGAATYRFQIGTDPELATVVYSAVTTLPFHTPSQRLDNNLYYWRVTPIDKRGHAGPPSDTGIFTFDWSGAPSPLAPDHGAELAFVPRFSWTAVEAAKEYRLQISTQENFVSFNQTTTRNTDYTPTEAFSNDQDYFWRVQAVDYRGTTSPWSEARRFRARWSFKPQLLSPANNSIGLAYPFFSWASVPGAERYQIQIASTNAFENSKIVDTTIYNVTHYTQPSWSTVSANTAYYWQVRAIDARGNFTPWSEVWSFQISDPSATLLPNIPSSTTPNLVYPLPYYTPDTENLPAHGDRSFAWPLFIWDTAHAPDPSTVVVPADFYRLEVDNDKDFFSPSFTLDTAGIAAAPTMDDPFTDLQEGSLYYWRVRAYHNNLPMGNLVTWTSRYSSAVSTLPVGSSPDPIYPSDGFEAVEIPPVLGWLPVAGVDHYRVQIARDQAFVNIVDEERPQFVNYVPWQSQLEAMPFGAYWWRVRGEDGDDNPIGDWGALRHFNLSVELTIGNPTYDFVPPANLTTDTTGRAHVADSPDNGAGIYEVKELYVIADRALDPLRNQNWVIAFTTGATSSDTVRYALYFDTDHVAGSGGVFDPRGNTAISTDPLYRPEYVLYVDKIGGGGISAQFYGWKEGVWSPAKDLTDMGGQIETDPILGSIQIRLPYTALGSADTDWVGSLALTVFSLEANAIRDTIPAQGATLDNPVFVSNMLLPLYPFDTPFSNPLVYEEMPPLRWRMPSFSTDGYQVQVAQDAQFTDIVETWESYESSTTPLMTLLPTAFQSKKAYADNESYYWRVRTRHERFQGSSFDYGPWSPAMRFKLDSRRVGNPQLSTGVDAFMTPTFTWDRVEGASGYTLQIDNDGNFSSPLLNQATDANSFTPTDSGNSLLPGTQYYWRVVMRRSSSIIGHWTETMTFTKSSLWPTPLPPLTDSVLNQQPTLRWAAVLTPTQQPRLATPSYHIQVANNPAFTSPKIDQTLQTTSLTPIKGKTLSDGVWYWRVALVDGNNKTGPYSPAQQFTKEYPLPSLIGPPQETSTGQQPTFAWQPIPGAAYYKIEYANNSSYDKSTTITTDLTRVMPTKALTYDNYYWRVQMFDADNNAGSLIQGRFSVGYRIYLPGILK